MNPPHTQNIRRKLKILIDSSEKTIVLEQVAEFSLKIENVENLFGVAVEISFDSTLVEIPVNCLTTGEFWGNSATFTQSISEPGRLSRDSAYHKFIFFIFNIYQIVQVIDSNRNKYDLIFQE